MTEAQFATATVFILALLYFADMVASFIVWQRMRRIQDLSPERVTQLGRTIRRKFVAYTIGGLVAGFLWLLAGIDIMTPDTFNFGFEERTLFRLLLLLSMGFIVTAKFVMAREYGERVSSRLREGPSDQDGRPTHSHATRNEA